MIKSITLKQPCSESWDNMTAAANGRYCASCEKNVVDFTAMSNDEILAFMAGTGNICGRIGQGQLTGLNYSVQYNQRSVFTWKKFSWAVAMLALIPAIKAQAQTVKIEQVPLRKQNNIPTDSSSRTVSGVVVARDDGLPIPGVHIRVNGLVAETQTGNNGRFSVDVPPGCDTLEFSFIGYERQEIAVSRFEDVSGQIALKTGDTVVLQLMMMGGFVANTSFFHRLWWHIKSPVVAIFRHRYY